MKAAGAWFLLLMLALVLIIAGFQGSFGKIMAVVFVPGDIVVGDASAAGGCPPGQIKWFGVCQPNPWGIPTDNAGNPAVTI